MKVTRRTVMTHWGLLFGVCPVFIDNPDSDEPFLDAAHWSLILLFGGLVMMSVAGDGLLRMVGIDPARIGYGLPVFRIRELDAPRVIEWEEEVPEDD